jgi:hypothetical protein
MKQIYAITALAVVCALMANAARAQDAPAQAQAIITREALSDAWWTGPMLAPSPATLPQGHILIEPYFYDVREGRSNGFGTLSYVMYGLVDKLTIGVIPTGGFNMPYAAPSSSGVQSGDTTLLAQYRLRKYHEKSWVPMMGLVVEESLPMGRFDELGDRMSDGFGSGAYTTTLGLYSQKYFWMPNGRILRARLDVSASMSNSVKIQGASVYGTDDGFSGIARPGKAAQADIGLEYSLTKKWVLAVDVMYRFGGNTSVSGTDFSTGASALANLLTNSGTSDEVAFAPAFEYNWRSYIGVLLGTRLIPAGHNVTPSVTPVIAINFVH